MFCSPLAGEKFLASSHLSYPFPDRGDIMEGQMAGPSFSRLLLFFFPSFLLIKINNVRRQSRDGSNSGFILFQQETMCIYGSQGGFPNTLSSPAWSLASPLCTEHPSLFLKSAFQSMCIPLNHSEPFVLVLRMRELYAMISKHFSRSDSLC